jgi:hypothetical protein
MGGIEPAKDDGHLLPYWVVTIPLCHPDGRVVPFEVELLTLFNAFRTARKLTRDETQTLINLAISALSTLSQADIPDRDSASDAIMLILDPLNRIRGPTKHAAKALEEDILEFTYKLLRDRRGHGREGMSHTEAAEFASQQLGRAISTNAWRMKLARWALKNKLPPVQQRHRKP